MYAVSIDAGGTMTDAIVSRDGERMTLKVDSTPHDLTVSLMNCLTEAGARLGYATSRAFLADVSLIRWSSTVTSNALGELKGAKVGAVVAKGAEETLYGPDRSPAIGTVVAAQNVFGVEPGAAAPALLAAVKNMLRRGVRRICICLPGSFPDNHEERRLKALITEQYPDHFLGSVPVILGSEITQTPDDRTRAHHALINAYVHPPLAASLFKCEDRLKEEAGWNGPLLIGHTDGGVARVGKTRAIDTIESGPVFGLFGAAAFATRYAEKRVICLDIGGTTTKASIARDGRPVFWRDGDLFGIPTSDPLALLRSCSVGGGSVATWDQGSVRLGPQSMGAAPGPACYGLGGASATLADACLVLGYLDAENFHGGRRRLDAALAARAIDRHIGAPAGIATATAALGIRDRAVAMIAELVAETAARAGEPVDAVTLFATGGNGAMLAPFVAERLGIARVYVFFALGPVFSAFGCDTSDVAHTYRKGVAVALDAPDAGPLLAATLADLRARAVMDLEGEGFDPARARFIAEVEIEGAAGTGARVSIDDLDVPASELAGRIAAACGGVRAGAAAPRVCLVALRAVYALPVFALEELPQDGAPGAPAGAREIHLSTGAGAAPVYDWTQLARGQTIAGAAMIGGGNTTCVIPAGWTLAVDRFGNGVMTR